MLFWVNWVFRIVVLFHSYKSLISLCVVQLAFVFLLSFNMSFVLLMYNKHIHALCATNEDLHNLKNH